MIFYDVQMNWDYTYCEKNGLDFVIHYLEGELYFDTDYKDDLFLLDLGDRYELVDPNETLNDILFGPEQEGYDV